MASRYMLDPTKNALPMKKTTLLRTLVGGLLVQVFTGFLPAPRVARQPPAIQWEKIDEGLETAEVVSPQKSFLGDSRITVVRINPARYAFKLVAASEFNTMYKTAPEWCKDKKLVGCVNAGQFSLKDGYSNMGYMKNYAHVNNPNFRKINNYNSVLAFNRKDTGVAPVQIIDLKCRNWAQLQPRYHSFSQSISLISCNRQVVDNKQKGRWSMVLFGMDTRGNALWIFTRSPYTIRHFSEILLSLPLSLQNVMYLEGGPEASLFLAGNGKKSSGRAVTKPGSTKTTPTSSSGAFPT
jgi:hypothetical protein